MATKEKIEEVKEENESKNLYGEKEYTITLPLSRDRQDDVTVIVNGMVYKIQRGEEVTVPAAVYEVLMNSEKMRREAFKRRKNLLNK